MKKKPAETLERIIAAAIKLPNGYVCLMQPGAEGSGHKELLEKLSMTVNNLNSQGVKSGFLTSTGRWVDRYDARRIAYSAGQLEHKLLAGPTGELYSGDWQD